MANSGRFPNEGDGCRKNLQGRFTDDGSGEGESTEGWGTQDKESDAAVPHDDPPYGFLL